MARSVKKGPFVDTHLAKRLRLRQRRVIESQLKLGLVGRRYCRILLD